MGLVAPRRCLAGWLAGCLCLGLAAVSGCGDPQRVLEAGAVGVNARAGDILLRNTYVDEPSGPSYRPGDDATVWLRLINDSASADALVEVRSPVGDASILWDADCDGDAAAVSELPLRAARDGETGAAPFGAYRLVLTDLRHEVLAGDSVAIEFVFARNGRVRVDVLVEPSNGGWQEPRPLCPPSGDSPRTGTSRPGTAPGSTG